MLYRTSENSEFCERGCELFGFSKWQGKGVSGLYWTSACVHLGWSLVTDLIDPYGVLVVVFVGCRCRVESRFKMCVCVWGGGGLWYNAGSIVGAFYHMLWTQSSAPEDGQNYRPKHVEVTEIVTKPLLLLIVDCLYCRTGYVHRTLYHCNSTILCTELK